MAGTFNYLLLEMTVIFGGASLLGTLFVWLKQPIILAYILLGILVGPFGARLIVNVGHIENVSSMGIILLFFLLGLHLHPSNLFNQIKQTVLVTFICISVVTISLIILLVYGFSFTFVDSLIAGVALSFSSTVISLKLIPTSTLHHRRVGEVMISILLFEDILAIITILVIYGSANDGGLHAAVEMMLLPLKTILLIGLCWVVVRYFLLCMFRKFDIIPEYIFLISLGWCFSVAQAAEYLGLSHGIGAFIAGVTIATSPIALVIAQGLKPVREFFLILFFFSIGAQFDPFFPPTLLIAVVFSVMLVLVLKPLIFRFLLANWLGHTIKNAKEMGLRLGQSSEFSLLLACSALASGKISHETAQFIDVVAVITFVISTYVVVYRLPTPISPDIVSRRD